MALRVAVMCVATILLLVAGGIVRYRSETCDTCSGSPVPFLLLVCVPAIAALIWAYLTWPPERREGHDDKLEGKDNG
jgi:hypothetical protein